jgi:hypothetical protein
MDNDNDSSMATGLGDCEARQRRLAFKTYLDALGGDGRKWFGGDDCAGPT